MLLEIVDRLWSTASRRLRSGRGMAASILTALLLIAALSRSDQPASGLLAITAGALLIWWLCWWSVGVLLEILEGLLRGRPPQVQVGRRWQASSTGSQDVREDANARLLVDRGGIWTSCDHCGDDVKALVFVRERRQQRKLQHARAVMSADGSPAARRRDPIPSEVKRAVWERDEGRCVECNGAFEIQYDHVIPFSLGGASTVENLQLLCARCNQSKGARL